MTPNDRESRRTPPDVHGLIQRAYDDKRFPPPSQFAGADLRMFTITLLWVSGVERQPGSELWQRVGEIMHLGNRHIWRLIATDAPRYEPPAWQQQGGVCEEPRPRTGGICGRHSAVAFHVTSPEDGTWRMAGYCSRHLGRAEQVQRAEQARIQAGGIPEPLPNTGGLLPCYLAWDWAPNYARAVPGWVAPQAGISADGWAAATPAPHLSVVPGSGGGYYQEALFPEPGRPAVRLVVTNA